MESGWTSKNAILRDLSVAQGREVPVEIRNTVTKNEKPPALNCTEETEQEFFENLVSSGDFSTGPDTTLIQQMLDMVREIDVTDTEVDKNTVVEISKIPISQGSGDGSHLPVIIKSSVENKKKTKRKKNVAVASLIAAYGDHSENGIPEITNLLKPNDFAPGNDNNKQAMPVDESLKSHTPKDKELKTVVSPTFMFKKKSPIPKTTQGSMERLNSSPITVQSEGSSPSELIKPGCFVPSSHAGEYYKKYVERNEMQEKVKEDIWSRAERQMKEIDAKRKEESTSSSTKTVQKSCEAGELHGKDHIQLPHHHALPEECKVCDVLSTQLKQ